MNEQVGLRLYLEEKRTLTIGATELELQDPSHKKTNRSSCGPFVSDAGGQQTIPLYNILWAELSNGKISIEYATQPSKARFTVASLSCAVTTEDQHVEEGDKTSAAQDFVAALLDRAYGKAQKRKRAYVLINPNSGPGGAVRRWNEEVKPLLEAARMTMNVVTLTRGGEATELAKEVDVDKYDTIMACSGDGTPHEIFNGLGQRSDATAALSKIAISHIPCGSGNAMACNLYGSSKPTYAALAIIKGVVTPLDLVSITQGETRLLSFLSQALGIIAESDLGTEHLRWMGSTRFEVGIITRLFQKRCYPCDLAVKVKVEDKRDVKAHYRRHASDASSRANPFDDGAASGAGQHEEEGLPELKYGTIRDELPEGWELVSYDKIGNFYCGNMAYMTPNANFFSAALASDGCMDLVMVNGDISLLSAIKAVTDVESGRFFDNPNVTYQKIAAYRIIPRDQADGYISIDGERVPFEPFQAEIHQALGRVISKKGVYEAEGPMDWDKVSLTDRIHA